MKNKLKKIYNKLSSQKQGFIEGVGLGIGVFILGMFIGKILMFLTEKNCL